MFSRKARHLYNSVRIGRTPSEGNAEGTRTRIGKGNGKGTGMGGVMRENWPSDHRGEEEEGGDRVSKP